MGSWPRLLTEIDISRAATSSSRRAALLACCPARALDQLLRQSLKGVTRHWLDAQQRQIEADISHYQSTPAATPWVASQLEELQDLASRCLALLQSHQTAFGPALANFELTISDTERLLQEALEHSREQLVGTQIEVAEILADAELEMYQYVEEQACISVGRKTVGLSHLLAHSAPMNLRIDSLIP
ncbi:MAG: hypothetical protein SGPRY_006369 [Prymnesium sp.]